MRRAGEAADRIRRSIVPSKEVTVDRLDVVKRLREMAEGLRLSAENKWSMGLHKAADNDADDGRALEKAADQLEVEIRVSEKE